MTINFQAPINARRNAVWADCEQCGDLFEVEEGGIICRGCGTGKCNNCLLEVEGELNLCSKCVVKKFKEMERCLK